MIQHRFLSVARYIFVALALAMSFSAAASAPAPSHDKAHFETRFMTGMIDHHGMAVEMASLCEQKAVHSELRELCIDLRAAQQQEIGMLQGWLLDWYNKSHAPTMSPADKQQLHQLSHLSGSAFEVAFMESMVRHHHIAIVRSSVCLDRAYHGALIGMCEDMIQAQLDESRMMKDWLCQWYGRCPRP